MDEFGERGGFKRRFRRRNFNNIPKPVAVGDVFEVTIEATGSKGDGIAKKDGFVIFVKGASQGQTVKVKITSLGRTFANAEVVGEEAVASAASITTSSEPADTNEEDLQ